MPVFAETQGIASVTFSCTQIGSAACARWQIVSATTNIIWSLFKATALSSALRSCGTRHSGWQMAQSGGPPAESQAGTSTRTTLHARRMTQRAHDQRRRFRRSHQSVGQCRTAVRRLCVVLGSPTRLLITDEYTCLPLRAVSTCRRSSGRLRVT